MSETNEQDHTPKEENPQAKPKKSRPWLWISLGVNLGLILFIWLIFAYYRSSYRSEISEQKERVYAQKMEHFKTLPNHRQELVFLGGSLVAEGLWAELFANKMIKNRGIYGDKLKGVLARLAEVSEAQPAKVFILLGKEDLLDKRSLSEINQDYQSVLTFLSVKSPDTKLYLCALPPVNPHQGQIQPKNEDIKALNKKIAAMATEFRAVYIDLYEALAKDDVLNSAYSNDGLHLNGAGYKAWQQALKPHLK